MGKSLLEELQDARVSNDPAYVEFYNTGEVRREERGADNRMTYLEQDDTIRGINFVFRDGAETYARKCSYDTLSLGLEIGLIYNEQDIGPENRIKENAKPLNGMVHVYTGEITSYLDGKQSNEKRYYSYSRQGFVDYNKLVSNMKRNGITFAGPQNFECFKAAVLSKEPFDISLKASLKTEEEIERDERAKQPVTAYIEEQPVDSFVKVSDAQPKAEPVKQKKRVLSIPFFKQRMNKR